MEDRPLEDRQLLQRFVRDNSQEAFAVLTARYLNLVYAVCRRELNDADAAEDVTQAVFLILARKAPSLGRNVVLSGWLFQTARFAAKNARLTAQRRAAYEQKAAEVLMEQQMGTHDSQWTEIEPLLNQSLAALKAGERECVLLRFFQGASFAEVGASLGLSEDAARKRVTRSLGKMRQFFTQNGVIVPAIALPVLLTTHAAKAAPAACQASIASLTHSVLAGHTTAALTGSHAYQLSEGTLKAMKLVQLKLAAGITAAVLGVSTYAVTRGIAHPLAKPGHVFQQTPGQAMTAVQIAGRCRDAYAALRSYQGTTSVTEQANISFFPVVEHRTATIQFARPGKIHAEGRDSNLLPWAYTSDGVGTMERSNLGGWRTVSDTQSAIATITGITLNAGTTIPAVLLHTNWGTPLGLGKSVAAEVREDNAQGQPCYVLTANMKTPTLTETEYLWVDEKTYLLRRLISDREQAAQTLTVGGKPLSLPASQTHMEEQFTDERINQPIPNSTFTLPAVQ